MKNLSVLLTLLLAAACNEHTLPAATASAPPTASATVGNASAPLNAEQSYRQAADAARSGNYTAAYHILLPLAQQGDATAQNNIAVLYQDGLGVKQDDAQALSWYRKAAEQGFAEAQFNVGLMYAQGNGVAQDYAQAAQWYEKAAKQGHADAQNNLAVRYASGSGVARDLDQARHWFAQAALNGHPTAAASLKQLELLQREGKLK